jgi:hypothetical protein
LAAVAGLSILASKGRLEPILQRSEAARIENTLRIRESRISFLQSRYLEEPYIIASELESALNASITRVREKYPEISLITAVGGKSNGSFVLRSLEQPNPGSDLDFYLGGREVRLERLQGASREVQKELRSIGVNADALLNGSAEDYYLNLDQLPRHIAQSDLDLLVLPFRCSFGETSEARAAVLEAIIAHPNKNEIWSKLVAMHNQSLSMHHGSWSIEFNNEILNEYMPEKVARFGLPDKPEVLLAEINSHGVR